MSITDIMAVISFGLTCFSLGYTLGKDNNVTPNGPLSIDGTISDFRQSRKSSGALAPPAPLQACASL